VATYPVLRQVPGKATYMFAFARVDEGVQLIRDLLRPLGLVERDAAPDNIDRMARSELGFSPLAVADLAGLGIAVDRDLVVFSTGVAPTLLVPVADAQKLGDKITQLIGREPVVITEHRGVMQTVMKDGADGFFVAWAPLGDRFAFHVGSLEVEASTTVWLNELLDAPAAALAREADLDWAFREAGARHDAHGADPRRGAPPRRARSLTSAGLRRDLRQGGRCARSRRDVRRARVGQAEWARPGRARRTDA
jgi:hypothetical protein